MPRLLLSALTTAVLCVGTVQAQERPDFTGTWVQEAAGSQPGVPTTLTITDKTALFTVEGTSDGQSQTITFSLVGEPEALQLFGAPKDGVGGATIIQEAKALWRDGHLETFLARQISGRTVTQTVRYTLDQSRTRMTVEQTLQMHHGYDGPSGGASKPVSTVYVKR